MTPLPIVEPLALSSTPLLASITPLPPDSTAPEPDEYSEPLLASPEPLPESAARTSATAIAAKVNWLARMSYVPRRRAPGYFFTTERLTASGEFIERALFQGLWRVPRARERCCATEI